MQGVDLRAAVERDFYFCTIYSFFFRIFGLGAWFWAVQFMWQNFNKGTCIRGVDLLDFVNFFAAMIYSAAYGAGLLALVLCCPF